MTNLPELITLLTKAERAYTTKSEDDLNDFLEYYNVFPDPGTILEGAILEVIGDLTVHEYMCFGEHEHEEQV